MPDIRKVTERFAVAPQIQPADIAAAAAQGFRMVINNRPDAEEPGQPTDAEMRAAAVGAGLGYAHIPIRGGPTPEQVAAMRALIEGADGPVLAFCRSGTRSITTWALSEAERRPKAEVLGEAAAAGYDLRGPLG